MGLIDHVPKSLDEVAPLWRWVGAGALAVTGYTLATLVHYGVRKVRSRRERAAFRERNKMHKEEFAERIRQIQPGRDHDAICALSVTELQRELQNGSLKPSQVLRAYQRKAADANEKTNCVADYILEAEELAAKLDNDTKKGPLYGIPISVKEIHPLKGHVSTWGNYLYQDRRAEVTFIPTEVLISQGAVPFVRSNTPYMALSYTGLNPLYGNHGNPHDPTRHPGGSSGGEAALVAAGATPIGIGSDIGGSIRNPAAMCGIVGLKCGITRLSSKGILHIEGLRGIVDAAYGPMTRDVDSAAFVMRHLLVDHMYQADRTVPPIGWRDHIYEDRTPLRIGYYINNGVLRAVPAVERAVRIAKGKLEEAGHTLVPFELPENDGSPDWSWSTVYFRLVMGDGGQFFNTFIGGDAHGKELVIPKMPFPWLPMWFNYMLAQLVKLYNREKGKGIESICESSSVSKWWALLTKFQSWRRTCLEKLETHRIDAILSPAMVAPAMPLKINMQLSETGSYLTIYNLLDWPAGVVPVTKVTVNDVADMRDYPTHGPHYNVIQQGMNGSSGLPVNVQIAAPPYGEELILRVLKEIEESVARSN